MVDGAVVPVGTVFPNRPGIELALLGVHFNGWPREFAPGDMF
jgi:hypothetical protein